MIGVTHRQLVEIGQRIRDKRESMSLTQENAAEIMDISLTHYKNIERGRASMSLTMLMTICERFSMDHTYILTGKNIKDNPILDLYEGMPERKRKYFENLMDSLEQLLEK